MILRNETGQIIISACRFLHSCTEALEAELLACLEGLDFALQQSQLPILIETDCLNHGGSIQQGTRSLSAHAYYL
jgi:hypothetical protein